MKAPLRRKEIAAILLGADSPVSGSKLAEMTKVSRQIIVQDIAALKADGYQILSTHQGYVIEGSPLCQRVFKVYPTREQTKDELTCIVELGGTVVDVMVHHKVYGKLTAPLNIFSPHGVDQFMENLKNGRSTELMHITSGYHYHTVRADSTATLRRIEQALIEKGYITPET